MEIETDRLFIKLLTLSQLNLWVNNISPFEKETNCIYDAEPIEGGFKNIINERIKSIENDPENYIYYSFWLIIRKKDGVAVGAIDFKNIPSEGNEVEIGYGLGAKYEHNGYMTEAVKGFCEFAFRNLKIDAIVAETETENIPSQKVLRRNGLAEIRAGTLSSIRRQVS
jgi:RimJ/RimL family protein N-acetyltransferase